MLSASSRRFRCHRAAELFKTPSGSRPVSDSDSEISTTSRPEQPAILHHRNFIHQPHSPLFRITTTNTSDPNSYTAVIDGLGRSGSIDESLKLFGEMKERRIRPSLYLYRAVISNLKKMGKVEMAASFMEEMNSCASSLRASRKSNKCE